MQGERTDQGLLAELLGLCKVLLPLEKRQGLVDEGKDVHAQRLGLLLHLHGRIELLDRLLVLLLVEQQLSVVVVHIWHLAEVLGASSEHSKCRGDGSHLVLRDSELDVREDKVSVKINGLLVVFGCVGELAQDEM